MSDSILQAGLQGLHNGIDQFGRASGQITTATNSSLLTSNANVDNLVAVKQAQQVVETSAAVTKVADEILGSLLDKIA